MDWGTGRYELSTAAWLDPVARLAVERLAPRPGEHVLDLGCGSGNATLFAAARGAQVTGVDPSERLLKVAADRAARAGLRCDPPHTGNPPHDEVVFMVGEAGAVPLADASADAAVSVFAVIFAPDAPAAAAELARVLRPGGRLVLTAWLPGGAFAEAARERGLAFQAAGLPLAPAPFTWHDARALEALFGPLGFRAEVSEHQVAFTADSMEDLLAAQLREHPMWIEARSVLAPPAWTGLTERLRTLFTEANEDPSAFRATSSYVLASLTRQR